MEENEKKIKGNKFYENPLTLKKCEYIIVLYNP